MPSPAGSLGKGDVHGELISCIAHGLKYNRDGQCVSSDVSSEAQCLRLRTWA